MASKPTPVLKNDFSAGEVSPRLKGRADLEDFARGVKTCLNWIPFTQGAITTRPGTIDVAGVKTESARTRFIPFKRGTTAAYAIEFGNLYFRVYYNNAGTYTRLGTVEVTTPYTTAQLQDIQFIQSNDILYLAHPSHADRKLIRVADDNWSIEPLNLTPPPTQEIKEAPDATITLPAITGNGLFITVSAATFLSTSDEGKIITAGKGRLLITNFVSTTEIIGDVIDDFDALTYTSGNWWIKGTPYAQLTPSAVGPVNATITLTLDAAGWRFGGDSLPTDLDKYVYINGGIAKIIYTTDISTGAYDSKSIDVGTAVSDTSLQGLVFSTDGTKMYVRGRDNDRVYQYTLSTAWDITTAVYASKFLDISNEAASSQGFGMSLDGTKLYLGGGPTQSLFQYNLSTAWDLSTGAYTALDTKDVSGEMINAGTPLFRPDGKKMYVVSFSVTASIFQYTLGTPWSLKTATYDTVVRTIATEDTDPRDMAFNIDGTIIYLLGEQNGKVYEYALTTPYDLSTATYASREYSPGQDTSLQGIAFRPGTSIFFILGDQNDTVYQHSLGSDTALSAKVIKVLTATTATYDWTLEQPIWNSTDGYPSTVVFHQDRLIWGGSTGYPQTIAGSKVGDYENHARGTADADAWLVTLNAREVNSIEWLMSRQDLIVGTTEAEWAIQANAGVLTPSDIGARLQTSYGSKSLRPAVVDGSILFFQRLGRKFRELTYDFNVSGYTAPEMTLIAEHITKGGIEEIAYQQSPFSIIWMVRSDGQLIGFTYDKKASSIAWHRHVMGGAYSSGDTVVESVCAIPHPTGDYDELWMIVKRTINSVTSRRIEVMTKVIDDTSPTAKDFWQLDSGHETAIVASASITGLSAWEGETLTVINKTTGGYLGTFTVASGVITLTTTYTATMLTGYPYNCDLEGLEPVAVGGPALGMGQRARISKMSILTHNSLAGQAGSDLSNLSPIQYVDSNETAVGTTDADLVSPPALLSQWTAAFSLKGSADKGGKWAIRQNRPYPMTILALLMEVDPKYGSTG